MNCSTIPGATGKKILELDEKFSLQPGHRQTHFARTHPGPAPRSASARRRRHHIDTSADIMYPHRLGAQRQRVVLVVGQLSLNAQAWHWGQAATELACVCALRTWSDAAWNSGALRLRGLGVARPGSPALNRARPQRWPF